MEGLKQDPRGRDSSDTDQDTLVEAANEADNDELNRFQRWREGIRSRPTSRRIYRAVVGTLGGGIVVGGLVLVPLPGPGWVIVFVGLAILASEFTWAARLQDFGKRRLKAWTDWLKRQPIWVRGLVGLATFAFVCCVMWALFAFSGVPGWIPDTIVPPLPGLD